MKFRRLLGSLITTVLTATAAAEEREPAPPCHAAGDTVVCNAEGFKTLVAKCNGYRTDRDLCEVDLEEARRKLASTKASLDLCLSTPVPTPPPQPPSMKPAVTLVLGAVGAGLLISTAAFTTAPTDTKVILGSAGLLALGTGLWLSF